MALGGGTFTSQNKELPGAYINFVSAASASAALSDRGIATMPLELDWGVEGEVFEVTNEDFQKNSLKLFGYAFDSPKMLGLNDLFMGAKTLYAYRLNGGGDKAVNAYAKIISRKVVKSMKKYGKVRSTKQPEQKVIDDYSVWIAENITPVTEAGTDEQPGFTGYEYDLTQYTKDEYIKMIDDRNASLEDQMTQAQEAMCEIYEMMA